MRDQNRVVPQYATTPASVRGGIARNAAEAPGGGDPYGPAAETLEAWTLEGRIPWKSFLRTGGRPEPGDQPARVHRPRT